VAPFKALHYQGRGWLFAILTFVYPIVNQDKRSLIIILASAGGGAAIQLVARPEFGRRR
jgi:hypothetical protein